MGDSIPSEAHRHPVTDRLLAHRGKLLPSLGATAVDLAVGLSFSVFYVFDDKADVLRSLKVSGQEMTVQDPANDVGVLANIRDTASLSGRPS